MLRLLPRLSYANVLSTVAVFIAMGGTSYAVATGSIDSREIRNNTLGSGDVRNNTLRSRDVRNGALIAADFRPGQLPAGPQGPAGPRGPAGATKAVVRLASSTPGVTDGVPEVAFVGCVGSERATGGGSAILDYSFSDGRPVSSLPNPTTAGSTPTGWGGSFLPESDDDDALLRTWVVCVSP